MWHVGGQVDQLGRTECSCNTAFLGANASSRQGRFVMGAGEILAEGVRCSDHARSTHPSQTRYRPQPGLLGCAAQEGPSWT